MSSGASNLPLSVISVSGQTGVVTLTKSDVGLGNVPNTDATNASNISTGTLTLARLPATSTAKIIYVSQDVGADVNDGTLLKPKKTIQAGITAAETIAAYYNQVIVQVTPSSGGNGYNENITMSQQGVTLQSASSQYRSDAVVIKGTITINLTGTSGGGNFVAASNIVYIKGFVITTNSGNTITFSGSTFQRLFLTDSYLDNTGTGSAIVTTNTGVSGATKSTITIKNSDINNNSASTPTILCSAGRIFISGMTYDLQNGNASGLSLIMNGAAATGATVTIAQATINGGVSVTDNLANLSISLSTISSGSIAGLTTPASPSTGLITLANVGFTTTATNTITGAGVVGMLGNIVKLSTGGDVISTVTQATINSFPQGALMLGAGATQTTNGLLTLKNGHIRSQQATASTVAVANSGSGGAATLTNATDIAGRINYTTGSGVITATATCTFTFNKSHATAPIVTLTPANANAGANLVQAYVTSTVGTFVINFGGAPVASTAYQYNYHVIGTQ